MKYSNNNYKENKELSNSRTCAITCLKQDGLFKIIGIACLIIMLVGCRAVPKKPPIVIPQPPKIPQKITFRIKEPVIRVGLKKDADLVSIKSNNRFRIILQDKDEIIKEQPETTVYFVPKSSKTVISTLYSLQVGAFSTKENAQKLSEELKVFLEPGLEVMIDESSTVFKVKVSGFKDKENALKWKSNLQTQGYSAWLVSEETGRSPMSGIQFYDESGDQKGDSSMEIMVVPDKEEDTLLFENKPYRGGFILFLNKRGRLNAINILNLEDYLKGVVPLEMGPYTYSSIEALKAQALAARTYAIRNMEQYKNEGYDICSTTACQVYGGSSVEDPLSNQAVEETRSEIITYDNRPISAMYTSTCGGHTEDVKNMFGGLNEPYLKGVPCMYEQLKIFSLNSDYSPVVIQNEDGNNLTAELFFMWKLRFFEQEKHAVEYFKDLPEQKEWNNWLKKMMIYLDISKEYDSGAQPRNFLEAVLEISSAINMDEKARLLFPSVANETLMHFSDASLSDLEAKKVIAYFISLKYLKPYSDNTLHLYDLPNRARILDVLYRILSGHRVFSLQSGSVIDLKGNDIKLKVNKQVRDYIIAENSLLAKIYSNSIATSHELKLAIGDTINFWEFEENIAYVEVDWSKQGHASDRTSAYSFWNVFVESAKIQEKVSAIKNIGKIIDLVPTQYGVSGRVIELVIKGEQGDVVLTGLKIRMTLGLRDNWFTIDRIIGNQPGFLFTGRGWGHGVGLCQVGSYGMALEGKNYKEILKHYYSNVDITHIKE